MLVAAAFVPVPPLLVPEIAGGSAALDAPLRHACRAAVGRLLDCGLDEVVVVGAGRTTELVEGSWDWRGFGVALPDPAPERRLPHALAIGSWLLDTHPHRTPPRRLLSASPRTHPQDCAEAGRDLVEGEHRVGLLVCGDGSACRTDKAPGYFDPEAEAWDDAAVTALGKADTVALRNLDPSAGRRLLATGRAPWQVMAGAAARAAFEATIDRAEAPYGVMYVVGTWLRTETAR
jgi:hypothetical protein